MRILVGAALLFMVLPVLLLLLFYPIHPITITGWVVWIFMGIPLTLLGEFLAEKIFSDKISFKIESGSKRVSTKRLFYGIIVAVVTMAMVIFIVEIIPNGIHEFIKKNFSNEW